jgi:hypothetical protein
MTNPPNLQVSDSCLTCTRYIPKNIKSPKGYCGFYDNFGVDERLVCDDYDRQPV